MKAYEYKIVHGYREEVEIQVSTLAQQGWELHGGLLATSQLPQFAQALKRDVEQVGPWS